MALERSNMEERAVENFEEFVQLEVDSLDWAEQLDLQQKLGLAVVVQHMERAPMLKLGESEPVD